DEAVCQSDRFARVFAGNELLPGMQPHATCYGGHQFGNWAGQLGDGRAINLGEVVTAEGRLMLQLKGAGETPFSRTADGLAVLRSSVREFLCSEAMHHLGVPTTRALSLCTTGQGVWRDMFYDGRAKQEPGAVVCRVAPTFLRFGHFEILAARRETELLAQLVDFTIREYFPDIAATASGREAVLLWFAEVCDRTAAMIVEWTRVGFVHGVMNTDNMSILGLTIDYGPYGWLDNYDADWTPNTSDPGGRYCFRNQAPIAQWNLLQLANAIHPLIGEAAPLEACLNAFASTYTRRAETMMAAKLGLVQFDEPLVQSLLALFAATEVDMTLFYRQLGQGDASELSPERLAEAFYQPGEAHRCAVWLDQYRATLTAQGVNEADRRSVMRRTNPAFLPRNYLVQQAIDDAEAGDFRQLHRLMDAARRPYSDDHPPELLARRPDWARERAGCSQLSCSS
ncbi:MAG: YdiU family protein, partial [Pseudomonadales bacterium]